MNQEAGRRAFIVAAGTTAAGALNLAAPGTAHAAPGEPGRRAGPYRSAATVLHHGTVFTGVSGRRLAQALAIGRDGALLAVGTDGDVRRYIGRDTEVVNLRGGFVMPGLHDGHQHPVTAALELEKVSLEGASLTVPQIRKILTAALRDSADQEPDTWLEVSGWNMPAMLPKGTVVTARDLDGLPTRRPICVSAYDFHNAWVNARGLEVAGITKHTPDPVGGTIVRDASGEPTGVLKDAARELVTRVIPGPGPARKAALARRALALAASGGVTTLMDAGLEGGEGNAAVLKAVHDAAGLDVRTHVALRVDPDEAREPRQVLARLEAIRERYAGTGRLATGIVKLFMDGVMEYPAQTAALLEPYRNEGSKGNLYFDEATVTGLVAALGPAGWQVHAHTIGDRAVRTAVHAFEAAARRSGQREPRNVLAHLQLVHPGDVRRLARAGVLACMQLHWAVTDYYTVDAVLPYLGAERQRRLYPAGSLAAAGVRLSGGSDWPVDDFGPWLQIERAITRTGEEGTPPFNPHEGLSRLASLRMHTLGGAHQLRQDGISGTLVPGKQADLVHIDRDLLRVPAREIHGTQVRWTLVGGEVVHGGGDASGAPRSASGAARAALRAIGSRPNRGPAHRRCGCQDGG